MVKSVNLGGDRTALINTQVPSRPLYGQVLVKMRACGICQYDIKCFTGDVADQVYSASPGHEGVGIVEEVGEGVSDIQPGDKVTSTFLGGAMADYFVADRKSVEKIPAEVSEYQFWISEPVACVVNMLRQLQIEPGDRVVLIGCGYMGLLILQGLPDSYIERIVAIDVDEERCRLAERYGADVVINARQGDPVQCAFNALDGKAEVVIEAVGKPGTLSMASDMVEQGGRICIFGHHAAEELLPTGIWHMQGILVLNTTPFSSKNFHGDLTAAVRLMAKGVFDQHDLVNRIYPLSDAQRALGEVSQHSPDIIKAALVADELL